jgi:hypothetical protein
LLALVEMTRVTIGPGINIKTKVMSKKAENNCQFIDPLFACAHIANRHPTTPAATATAAAAWFHARKMVEAIYATT